MLIIFFGTFVFWVESLNNYDVKLFDWQPTKDKTKEDGAVQVAEERAATSTIADNPRQEVPTAILLKVPFTSQAPDGQWEDQRFQDGCEEAAVLMAMKWVKGEALSRVEAKATILDMADWQLQSYGSFRDTNAQDTAERLLRDYFSYTKYKVSKEVNVKNIVAQLRAGNLVLVPANGQKLNNPHYKTPGPERHMLVVRGYNPATDEFITNDAGTKMGEAYRYKTAVLLGAVIDYPTGNHEPIVEAKKAMIIVSK